MTPRASSCFRKVAVVVSGILLLSVLSSLFTGCGSAQVPVVGLDSGKVSGAAVSGLDRYLGIPYAAPPMGELRWRPPQPVESWEGVKSCTKVGPDCPQIALVPKKKPQPQSEDCLYLNVWTPAKKADEKLPVMFWIHGGAYQLGSGGSPLYDGEKLAKRGVVVVTINYRLGPLGFLSHPLLTQESANGSSGNYGLLDQQAALGWVKRNIAAFGGDPSKVTIFGESAGAMSVMNQLVSPLSAGLFHQAISESTLFIDRGLLMHATRPLAEAEDIGVKYATDIGCAVAPDVLAAMRAKPVNELLSTSLSTTQGIFIEDPNFVPVVDGWVIPQEPGAMVAAGLQHDVPLLLGSNKEEGNLFVAGSLHKFRTMPIGEYEQKIRQYFGSYADQVLAMYPVTKQSDVIKQLSRIFTAFDFTSVARFVAAEQSGRGQRVYLYQFDKTPPMELTSILGPCHGSELPFVFGTLVKGTLPDGVKRSWSSIIFESTLRDIKRLLVFNYEQADIELSDEMVGYWTRFARSGDPNGDGAPDWPRYEPSTDRNIELAAPIRTETGLESAACDLADQFYGYVK